MYSSKTPVSKMYYDIGCLYIYIYIFEKNLLLYFVVVLMQIRQYSAFFYCLPTGML